VNRDERIRAVHLRRTGGRDPGNSSTRRVARWESKSWMLQVASGEAMKGSKPSIRGGKVAKIQGNRELRGSRDRSPKVGCSKSRVVKPREDQSRPSEEDRWQRSRDLVNSEVHRVRV
jgi:hypothetical protein